MIQPLQIAIAHDDLETLASLHSSLIQIGHQVCFHAIDGRGLIEQCVNGLPPERRSQSGFQPPDLIIVKQRLPDMHGLEAASCASQDKAVPVILVLDRDSRDIAWSAERRLPLSPSGSLETANLFAVLGEPISHAALIPLIPLAKSRCEQMKGLKDEVMRLCELLGSDLMS